MPLQMSFTAGQLAMLGGVFGSMFMLKMGMPIIVGFALTLLGGLFYNSKPAFQLSPSATLAVVAGDSVVLNKADTVDRVPGVADTSLPDALPRISKGLDDLRRLGAEGVTAVRVDYHPKMTVRDINNTHYLALQVDFFVMGTAIRRVSAPVAATPTLVLNMTGLRPMRTASGNAELSVEG